MIEALADWFVQVMSALGYPGVAFLMALESMIAPVPSELVMPFAGYLAYIGKMTLFWAWLASLVGSLAGSLVSYGVGYAGGYPAVHRIGRYFLLDEHHLQATHRWFERRGQVTILVSRFIPVVRHLISIPAGVARMSLRPFLLYTALGAGAWNFILLYAGFKLGEEWDLIEKYSAPLDLVILALLAAAAVWYGRKWWTKKTVN